MSAPFFEVVILTSPARGAIHVDALRRSNPDLAIHIHESEMAPGPHAWRNCDRNILSAWRAMGQSIRASHVLFLEWDVLVTADLGMSFIHLSDAVIGAAVKSPVAARRSFLPFRELDRLPAWVSPHALGLVPSAVLMLPRTALDKLTGDPRCKLVFAADIISEIRLGSVVHALGHAVHALPGLASTVHTTPFIPPSGARGIFHPVKQEVSP